MPADGVERRRKKLCCVDTRDARALSLSLSRRSQRSLPLPKGRTTIPLRSLFIFTRFVLYLVCIVRFPSVERKSRLGLLRAVRRRGSRVCFMSVSRSVCRP